MTTNHLADLRARLAELSQEFRSNIDWSSGRSSYSDNDAWEQAAQEVEQLLADTAEPPLQVGSNTCPECRHAAHESLGFCPNMASDNDCGCRYKGQEEA